MKHFETFNDFHQYLGLLNTSANHIDIGRYEGNLRKKSEGISCGFYRISLKFDIEIPSPDLGYEPHAILYFSSPSNSFSWDVVDVFTGYYLQFTKEIVNKNQLVFKSFLDYGQHEPLFLNQADAQEIELLFKQLIRHQSANDDSEDLLISYTNVLLNLVEKYYEKQFKVGHSLYNAIVQQFYKHLNDYYTQIEVTELPSVHFFAQKLALTPNYLGDVIKSITGQTAKSIIQQKTIVYAKHLMQTTDLNNSQIAYRLGYEYPNYFAKVFKKWEGHSPSEWRNLKHD